MVNGTCSMVVFYCQIHVEREREKERERERERERPRGNYSIHECLLQVGNLHCANCQPATSLRVISPNYTCTYIEVVMTSHYGFTVLIGFITAPLY